MYLWCKDKVFCFNLQTFWEFFIRIELTHIAAAFGEKLKEFKRIWPYGHWASAFAFQL